MPKSFYTARKIFTGIEWLTDHVIVSSNGIIESVQPINDLNRSLLSDVGDLIVPSFVDLQIYGARKKLFAVYPGSSSLDQLVESNLEGGTISCLPTIATNTAETVRTCIETAKQFASTDQKGIAGLHLEGPWINSERKGAHIESLICKPTLLEVQELIRSGEGIIKMITLAPEMCSLVIIDYLRSENIVVSAGHSNANYKQAITAFDHGVNAVTHLFNAMSPFHHREPGLPGAAFDHPSVMASIIPDGHHVDFAVIRSAKKLMNERLFIITDAVTDTDEGFYPHRKAGDKYEASGILSGSALTMAKAIHNLVSCCQLSLDESIRMASSYPSLLAGLPFGKIEPGKPLALTILSDKLDAVRVIK